MKENGKIMSRTVRASIREFLHEESTRECGRAAPCKVEERLLSRMALITKESFMQICGTVKAA